MTLTKNTVEGSTTTEIEVDASDLPLACPRPQMTLWNMHPKVYLPIEKTGKASCPYCGIHYTLVEKT